MDKANRVQDINRRISFRIYDQVNLFYQKIDEQQLAEPYSHLHTILDNVSLQPSIRLDLPFEKHETCDVNISASGIAFNCEEEFQSGDYLLIKLLLVSTMTAIVTYCKVVYCKSDDPDQIDCPYFIGTHFVEMNDEDREALVKHINKKRVQQNWVRGLILAATLTVVIVPDVVFGILLHLLHFLFEHFLELLHITFEFAELSLDHLVEHFFHTDLHQTQIIVFYILAAFICYGLYRMCRAVPDYYRRCKKHQKAYWSHKKAALLYYWQEQSLLNRIKIVVIGIAAIASYVFFGM